MAEIPVERKRNGVPIWIWIVAALAIAAILLFLLLPRHDEPTVAVAPADAGAAAATVKTCTSDDSCAEKELCINASCQPVTANTGACVAPTTHFATGSDQPADTDRPAFDRMARCLRADQAMKLTISGDADQRAVDGGNEELAEKRARAVAHQLSSRGVSNAQLQVVSYGDHHLLCGDNDDACWAKNRRVDVQVKK